MTTRVYLVRHGSTVLAEDHFAGETDVPLSEIGRAQARALGARLAGDPIDAFYASPLERALETARLVAAPHGREVFPRAELREISHGRWEQKSRAEVESLYPGEYARWESDPFSFAPEGGETGLAVLARRDAPGVRCSRLSGPARFQSRRLEHPGLPRVEPGAAGSLQRHVALRTAGELTESGSGGRRFLTGPRRRGPAERRRSPRRPGAPEPAAAPPHRAEPEAERCARARRPRAGPGSCTTRRATRSGTSPR